LLFAVLLLVGVATAGCGGKPVQTALHPVFLAGATAADLIDVAAGGVLAAEHPSVAVGRAQCPMLLNLSGNGAGECTIPVAGKMLRIGVKGSESNPSLVDVDALVVTRDAERDMIHSLESDYGGRFTVRCAGPAVRVVPLGTKLRCTVASQGAKPRREELAVHDRAGHTYARWDSRAVGTSVSPYLGIAAARQTTGSLTLDGAAAARYLRATTGAEHHDLARRKLLGAAHCPPRFVLASGKHVQCTVAIGRTQLTFDLRFDEGRGLVIQQNGTILDVARARDLVRTAYEHALRVEGKPQRVSVRCAGDPVAIGEPGESLPCVVKTRDGPRLVTLDLLDAEGSFDIMPQSETPDDEE
jgi:hypothetical protein